MEQFDLRSWTYFKEHYQHVIHTFIDQVTIDSRQIHGKSPLFVALSGKKFDGHDFVVTAHKAGAKFAIVRHGFEIYPKCDGLILIHVDSPLRAMQELAGLYRKQQKCTVIAILGTYGKTMVKDLLEHVLSKKFKTCASPGSFNSQIGVALSLFRIESTDTIALIESGISQVGEIEYLGKMIQPDAAVIVNLGKERLGLLTSKHILAQEKLKIMSYVPANGWIFCPKDVTVIAPDINSLNDKRIFILDDHHTFLPKVEIIGRFQAPYTKLRISHNNEEYESIVSTPHLYCIDHLQLAVRVAFHMGMTLKEIVEAISTFEPDVMRIEVWKGANGATFINDTYCAEPISCEYALKQMDFFANTPKGAQTNRKIFIFGGFRKDDVQEGDLIRIAEMIAKHQIAITIILDRTMYSAIVGHLSQIAPRSQVLATNSIEGALELLKGIIRSDDIILIKGAKKLPFEALFQSIEEGPAHNLVVINLAAIQSNIQTIRERIGSSRIMVMVKANAYGTDSIRIARFLESLGIDILGVSYVEEAVALRRAGIECSLFTLNALESEAQKVVRWGIEVAVSEESIIEALENEAKKMRKKVRVHLHVDTGMTRFGVSFDKVVPLAQRILASPWLILEGVMTHFACADDPTHDTFTLLQKERFDNAIEELAKFGIQPRYRHAPNSSATARFGFSQYNMVRIGLATYGIAASEESRKDLKLHPSISLISRIVGINFCTSGETVSYGRQHKVEKPTAKIAVLPIGYFDGIHRSYSGKGSVIVNGIKAPMVGNICMDYMMADISDVPDAKIGDTVLIFGEDPVGEYQSPELFAQAGGSIAHELMTCLGPRIQRLFIYDESLRPR